MNWELIDGVPLMMPPPTLIHQRISANIALLLSGRLVTARPDWYASLEIGIRLSGDERCNPEPDVTVIDAPIGIEQIYAGRFCFVAQVL